MTLIPKEGFLKNIRILHLALLAGMAMMLTILTIFNVSNIKYSTHPDYYIFYALGVGAIIIGLFLGEVLFSKFVHKIPQNANLSKKITAYNSAFVVRAALREGPALINIIFWAFIESNILFLGGAVLIILIFLFSIPSKGSIINHLNLSREEGDQL